MLVGRCTKCYQRYFGWALSVTEYQICPNCGSKLAIHDETMDAAPEYKTSLPALENRKKVGPAIRKDNSRPFI